MNIVSNQKLIETIVRPFFRRERRGGEKRGGERGGERGGGGRGDGLSNLRAIQLSNIISPTTGQENV